MLELTVKTLDSQNHSFTVPDETTVRQLKESILEKMEVPVDTQRLIFHGKVLQDEKKLTDYGDVNGKVIHLVQRAPPPAGRPASNININDSNLRQNIRRSLFSHRDTLDSSTYLGSMAYPTDLMEAQGLIQPPPSQGHSRGRLTAAQRMLDRASSTITSLENNEGQQNAGDSEAQDPLSSTPTQSAVTDDVRGDADIFLGETTGSIAQAAQAATAAAIAAAVSAAHAAGVPNIAIMRTSSTQNDSSLSNADSSNTSLGDVNLNLNIEDHHPEDVVAVEVEIGANSDAGLDERHESNTNAPSADNSTPSVSNNAPSRPGVERTSAFATLLEQLEDNQRRFQPLLHRCYQLMVEDPSFTENSSPNAEECQRLFNGVSEAMHHFAHAYHALSDIMVDFNEDSPRSLRCRPVLIQHSAIVETGFPIQAHINLSTRRSPNESNSNLSGSESSQPSGDGNFPNAGAQASQQQSTTNVADGASATDITQDGPDENVTPQASATSFASATSQQSEDRSQSSRGGNASNTSGFFLSGPGNVEIFMDFGPEGVTLGSVETTVIRGEARNIRNNLGTGGIQIGGISGPGRPPIELLHAVTGQIQNHIMGRVNQAGQTDQPPPPYESNVAPTASEGGISNQSTSTQARSSSQTESSTATQTHATRRPHVHLPPAISGLASYDPFLPCNSHHIRSPRHRSRTQNSQGTSTRNGSEGERANSNAEGAAQNGNGGLGDSFMAMMAQLLHPQRVALNRQPRVTTMTIGAPASASGGSTPRVPLRRASPQASQPEASNNEAPRNANPELWTPPPINLMPGWPTPNQSPMNRRSIWDNFRMWATSNMPNADRNQFGGNNTIADFLTNISDNSYVEGESIVTDFFMTLARNLTWPDIIELSMARRSVVEAIVSRLRPALQTFVVQRLLQGEAPSEESIARACERLYTEMRPYIEVMQEARLRESVDLTATINNYNQSQLPEMIALIVDPSTNQSSVSFGQNMTRRVRNYMRQLFAIIIHCCQDGNQGFDTIVQSCVRLLTRGVPEELQQWTELNSVNNLRSYTATLNVPLEDIQRYLVYRIPNSTIEREPATESSHEPMETDAPANDTIWVASESIPSPEKVEEPITESLVAMDTENLPDVLIGSESWHNALPSEWVPIIARDTQRQRRQSSQKPFSDAYLSSLPPKRRKLITSAKPQGNLSQVISDGVRHAIGAAGVSSNVTERVIAEAGKDDVLQEAYKEQERVSVSADLKKNPDFTPNRFPNAFKYFDK